MDYNKGEFKGQRKVDNDMVIKQDNLNQRQSNQSYNTHIILSNPNATKVEVDFR